MSPEQRAKIAIRLVFGVFILAGSVVAVAAFVALVVGLWLYNPLLAVGLLVACGVYLGLIRGVVALWMWAFDE